MERGGILRDGLGLEECLKDLEVGLDGVMCF